MTEHTFKKLVLRSDVYCDSVEVTDENGFKVINVPGTPILLQYRELLGIDHWADDKRASIELSLEQQTANARRIVACVNACDGVHTELLEKCPAPFNELRTERDRLAAQNAALLGALKSLARNYVVTLEAGRDRIVFLGGDCDSVEVMERNDPYLRDAREAIAQAEQKGGES